MTETAAGWLSNSVEQPLTMLEVRNLKVHFPVQHGFARRPTSVVRAVDGVSFDLRTGETLGLVGESGSGKSTVGRAILRLVHPTSGEVIFKDRDIVPLSRREVRKVRRSMQMVFQDPYASLNPRMNVQDMLAEPIRAHGLRIGGPAVQKRVLELLDLVGLNAHSITRYPHEFSGGQRQRIGIARALAVEPELLICDEPVSALDVSIQAQIVNLLDDLQKQLSLTYLFIAHGLAVVKYISYRVAVMYLGKLVELANADDLFANPLHPYTQALLSAAPNPDPAQERKRRRIVLVGDVPTPVSPPSGCRFRTRCPLAVEKCSQSEPLLVEHEAGHKVACWRANESRALMAATFKAFEN